MKNGLGPDPYAELFALSALLPLPWKGMSADAVFESFRARLNFTQDELGMKAGLTQNQVSRLEGGFDARWSTWRKAWDAMGFDLFMLPMPRASMKRLSALAEAGRPPTSAMKQGARPRRRYAAVLARKRAERRLAQDRAREAAAKRERWIQAAREGRIRGL